MQSNVSSHDQQGVSDTAFCLPGSLINHVSSHDNRWWVALLYFFVSSIMFHPITNREWVRLALFVCQAVSSICLIPWPTGGEWPCFISLPDSLNNYISSYNQQMVSATALLELLPITSSSWHDQQIVSFLLSHFIASHSVTNSRLVTCHLCQSLLFIWQTACELACMSATQLIWWFHASLSSAYTFLFVFRNCKIYLYLWCIII